MVLTVQAHTQALTINSWITDRDGFADCRSQTAPRRPGVITVGSFHSGTKHNIISDAAKLQITVRGESPEDRQVLLDGIKRVAVNMGRVGLPDDMLPK